jgi:hypothetical protein
VAWPHRGSAAEACAFQVVRSWLVVGESAGGGSKLGAIKQSAAINSVSM